MKTAKYLPKINKRTVAALPWKLYRVFILFGLSVIILYPLLYSISIAFRPAEQLYDPLVILVPRSLTLDNIRAAIDYLNYFPSLLNSIVLDTASTLLQVLSCALVGYGLARFQFKGRGIVFAMVILLIIVPPQTVVIPNYLNFRYFDPFGIFKLWEAATGQAVSLNLINTKSAFLLPAFFALGIRSGLTIFIFRQFFRGMPKDLEEAAYIDGCGQFQTFLRIMAPNATPAFLTTFLFSIVWYWNDFVYTSTYMSNSMTVMNQLYRLKENISHIMEYDMHASPYEGILILQAGVLLAVLPLLIMYLFLQKHFTESIERTGIVG